MLVERKIAEKLFWVEELEDDVLDSIVEECCENGIVVDDILNNSDNKDLMEMVNSIGKFYEDGTLVHSTTPSFYDSEVVLTSTMKNIIIQRFYASINEYEEIKLKLEESGNPYPEYSKERDLALILISIENEFELSKRQEDFKEIREGLSKFLKIDLKELETIYQKQIQETKDKKNKSLRK